ncbi:GNAT family N-acetyltransferase [Micromonospora endolithica]|uniref:GNAT family N-acetyltransferase n=1 Tax=Micromonospora endolithica TaxID=230091 RepID=A0A3A9ZLI0_9ACTN|nr:GNAT family N-acetyltransferase [Micromonospora endolithica]RKN49109.1 GNAT family N-acetyltransferase [Micromonospora endolithica]TWJ23262.1 acetyltransferase (GNAT) family protein [Micromonospora endolithica]
MTTPPLIAPATLRDAGEILTVQRAAYLTEAQRYGDPFLPPLTETLEEVRAVLAGARTVLTARIGPRLVGSVRAHVEAGVAHVGRLAVAPDQQGRGIGGRLLRAIEAMHAARADRFALFTGAGSDQNLRLYQRHGYRLVGHRDDPNGVRLALLEKPSVSAVRSGA